MNITIWILVRVRPRPVSPETRCAVYYGFRPDPGALRHDVITYRPCPQRTRAPAGSDTCGARGLDTPVIPVRKKPRLGLLKRNRTVVAVRVRDTLWYARDGGGGERGQEIS